VRWRLAVAFVCLVAVVLVVQDVPLAFHLRRVERDRLTTALERDAYVLAGRSEELLEDTATAGSTDLDGVVADYGRRTGATVVVTDRAGLALAASGDGEAVGQSYANRPEIAAAIEGRFASGERQSRTLGEPLVYVAVPVRSGGDVLGTVRLTYPARVVRDRVAGKLRGLVAGAAISIGAAIAVAVVLASTVTRPLRRLRGATDALAAGDLATRAPPTPGPPEVRSLAASFDAMAARIERLVAAQRAFAADASHQLRTPLTALRLRIEQAAALAATDPAAAVERLDAASAEIDRLGRLSEGLLALAGAESTDADVGTVDVGAIARERAEEWGPLAEERGVTIEVDVPSTAPARAIPGAVEQVIDGYVDNALDVSPPGSTIRIAAEVGGGSVTLHVVDQGPGLDPVQRARAFDRFWQAPGTHSGSGLGLAITRQLATASGGTVELATGPGGGIDARARFRAAPPPPARHHPARLEPPPLPPDRLSDRST
jgi:signal transduction histidine kinase